MERIDHGASLALILNFCNQLSRATLLQKLQLQTSAAVGFRPPHRAPAPGSSIAPIAHAATGACAKRATRRAGKDDRIGFAIVVAEFDKRCGFIERLDDRADLASDEPVLRQVAEKRDGGEEIAPSIPWFSAAVITRPGRTAIPARGPPVVARKFSPAQLTRSLPRPLQSHSIPSERSHGYYYSSEARIAPSTSEGIARKVCSNCATSRIGAERIDLLP